MKLWILYLLLIVVIFPGCRSNKVHQRFFQKEKIQCGYLSLKAYDVYKIRLVDTSNNWNANQLCSYALNFSFYNDLDKIQMIEELLKFEGDTSVCAIPIFSYNPLLDRTYSGSCSVYSVQLEALFIINHIIYKNPYNYSPIPLLRDRRTGEVSCISGRLLDSAYTQYKDWLKAAKREGLSSLLSNGRAPLNSQGYVQWY